MVVHQDDVEIARPCLRGERGDGLAHDIGLIARRHHGYDARWRNRQRRGRCAAAAEFAPETAAEEQEVKPDGEGRGGGELERHFLALSRDNTTVRAWLMYGYDGVEKMRLAEVAHPQRSRGEVLLRVRYAAQNPADAFLR